MLSSDVNCDHFKVAWSNSYRACKFIDIFRREAIASAEYWIHFMARFDGVHASGYNSAESEPIWMEFGAL